MASRAQLVDQVIRPALSEGWVVVSDRYLLANVVYQGYAGGLDVEALWQVGAVAIGGIHPDVTFVLDMPVEAALQRMNRQLDRMESRGQDFMDRVRQGFLREAAGRPNLVVVDADRGVPTIQAEIRAIAESRWPTVTGLANQESQA
jgi:dTMP kinase